MKIVQSRAVDLRVDEIHQNDGRIFTFVVVPEIQIQISAASTIDRQPRDLSASPSQYTRQNHVTHYCHHLSTAPKHHAT